MKHQPTTIDVLEAIQNLATHIDETFATKEDLSGFATKEDLSGFATKEDLDRFATKEDLKPFATKDDLDRFATKEDMQALATHMDDRFATKDDMDEMHRDVVTKIDRIVTLHQSTDVELIALHSRCDRIEDRLERNQIR